MPFFKEYGFEKRRINDTMGKEEIVKKITLDNYMAVMSLPFNGYNRLAVKILPGLSVGIYI